MPRFYFDCFDGPDLIPDHEGLELDSLKAVEHEATDGRAIRPRLAAAEAKDPTPGER